MSTPPGAPIDPDAGTPSVPGSVTGAGEPSLVDLEPWDGLLLSTKGAYWRLSGAFGRLHTWMETHAVSPAGPALGFFYDDPDVTPPEECRYSICYPLSPGEFARVRDLLAAAETAAALRTEAPAPAKDASPDTPPLLPYDTVEARHFPAESAAVVEYEGPAADSPAVYGLLARFVATRGLVPRGSPRERYVAEPGTLGVGTMHAWVEQPVAPPD